jgi:hypothetical protein
MTGEPRLIMGIFNGIITATEAAGLGLDISGDATVLRRVLPEVAAKA